MRYLFILIALAAIASAAGCGVIGQTPGGAVSPSIAVYKNVQAASYNDHETYNSLTIKIPAGTKSTNYRVLFDIEADGIDPATLRSHTETALALNVVQRPC